MRFGLDFDNGLLSELLVSLIVLIWCFINFRSNTKLSTVCIIQPGGISLIPDEKPRSLNGFFRFNGFIGALHWHNFVKTCMSFFTWQTPWVKGKKTSLSCQDSAKKVRVDGTGGSCTWRRGAIPLLPSGFFSTLASDKETHLKTKGQLFIRI